MGSPAKSFSATPRFALVYEDGCINEAHVAAKIIRSQGHSATLSLKPGIKQGLKYAVREDTLIAVIYGQDEAKSGNVTLKRMADREQVTITNDAFLGGPMLNPPFGLDWLYLDWPEMKESQSDD